MENPITFRPQPRSKRTYGVSIKYFDEDQVVPSKRVDFQVVIGIEQYKNEDRTWQLTIDRKELFINQHEPDLISEQLAALAMSALYPVKVDVNFKNEIFRGIVNHGEIVKRWADKAELLSDKYAGDYTALFIKKMNASLSDPSEVERALGLDMFWSAFFHPQYLNYGEGLSLDVDFYFPIVPYQKTRFSGKQLLTPDYTDYNTYQVNFRAADAIPDEIKWNDRSTQVLINAKFDLDRDGGLLKNVIVNWGIYHRSGINAGRRIQFSAYEINTGSEKINVVDNMAVQATQPVVEKKGFWERILG
ncbi:hypothetical protein [Pedobacter duraquae]|uniref:Uncharacterized protein n=1 Tax=Pedobacter duraquae TaxID=425511 RepID=A0A4R6IEJ0_9SPHI|nr:hypothetical protein [Pedobacter duraquae]TDO20713.1 hypothetical protein CLV32_3346 [Pedobacter duraquae]